LQIIASEGSATAWRLRGAWQIKGLVPLQPPWPIPPTDWAVTFDADQSQAKADVHAEARERRITLAAQVSHNFATQQGVVQGTLGPVSFDGTMFRLSQIMTPWPYPFDLTEGQVSAKVDGTWGTDRKNPSQGIQLRSGTMSLSLNGLSGRYRNILVNGVTSTITLQATGWTALAMPQPAAVSIASINPGVELTNVAMTLQPEWQGDGTLSAVALRDLRWKMFGGEVTSQGLKAVLAAPSHTLPLTLHSLDLQKILSLEQQKGLQGTGVLDGTLPITIGTTGVSVKNGTLAARPPGGVIRYGASAEATKAITEANANMQLVLQTLNNFQYNVLQVGVQYVEDGTLNLTVRLEGKNPDQKKSPPIHFNLTVQENIPALLKSLRLMQDIEESVQKKFVKP
jgi:hypothetical protein